MARNQDNVSEWDIMSTRGLLLKKSNTMEKKQLRELV